VRNRLDDMKFSTQHQRAITGNDLVTGIEAENEELLARVACTLDKFELGTDELDPSSVSYERDFSGVGDAGPHTEHELKITVTDPNGKTKIAVRRWEDPV
jgi:hypothetical protein